MCSALKVIKRLKGKSAKTILFRGTQEFGLTWMAEFGGWDRLTRKINKHWSAERVQKLVDSFETGGRKGVLTAADAEEAFHIAFGASILDKEALVGWGADIRARKFKIFGTKLPDNGAFPWTTDWRFQHQWPPADFRSFNHHADRSVPYDVKYPWELSRLWFLPPLMQKAMLQRSLGWDQGHIEEVCAILRDFEAANPAGRSVNWYPMETAMRGISLVLLLDMLLLSRADSDKIALLLRMITLAGETLWRSIEYTDNRGNHYAANLVALLVMGQALSGHYAASSKWLLYAAENIEGEIHGQFLQDGVNFEKSSAYHGLVTELFLIARLVMSRQGLQLGKSAELKLQEACHYAAALRRPDGLIPLIGDTDDARVMALDAASPRDNANVVALGAILFEEPLLKAALKNQQLPAIIPWLMGTQGVRTWVQMQDVPRPASSFFQAGGMMMAGGTSHDKSSWLLMDAGEVGQNGVGGHGHNDILSFELFLDGHPFIVDPGCPTYTGEPAVRQLFRSTAWHNSLVIDSTEVADLTGPFRIADQAKPQGVSLTMEDGAYVFQGSHTGYHRLPSPVDQQRKIIFDPVKGIFECSDHVSVSMQHRADRYLHFAPDVTLQQRGNVVTATHYQHRYEISFDAFSQPYIIMGRVSLGYGHMQDAPILMLSTRIAAPVRLFISIINTSAGI